jgi:hypothetical protein
VVEHLGHFFLNIDDQFGAFQLRFQARRLALESSNLGRLRIGFATALGRGQALADAAAPLPSPSIEMGRVQAFTA